MQPPVIVIPGITGVTLIDEYPLNADTVWSAVLNKEFQRISMHPDSTAYEAVEPARVVPGRMFGLVYDDLVEELRYELTPRRDEPTPVFAFPYDWRQSLASTAARLGDFVGEVVARTSLLRHYRGWSPEVDLVGHSMGGLVIAEYVADRAHRKLVRKIATLATPFEGSIEAVVKLATGLGTLTAGKPSEREREAARSMPSIYHLLPGYKAAVERVGATGAARAVDLFDANEWQPGIVRSLGEYIRLWAVDPDASDPRALLSELLDEARRHRERVRALVLDSSDLESADWLVIVGAGEETRVHMQTTLDAEGNPRFVFDERTGENQLRSRSTGDGTVPLAAALPRFVPEQEIVVVTPGDLSFFEFKDRILDEVAGFHAVLPNVNAVRRLVIKHLRPSFGAPLRGRPLPGVTRARWTPPTGKP
jgi:pimeloyl-ACP methyl ester carboxylesterase